MNKNTNLISLAVIIYVIYLINELFIKKKTNQSIIDVNESLNESNITPGIYHQQIADSIWNYTKVYGTNEDAILDVLDDLTIDDLKLVYVKFGTKTYELLGGVENITGFNSVQADLIQVLKKESKGYWDENFRMQLEQIWQPTGLW